MSKRARDGGPAFPVPNDADVNDQEGMSLRDWFAGQALPGIASDWTTAAEVAIEAYALADAMIAERERVGSEPVD